MPYANKGDRTLQKKRRRYRMKRMIAEYYGNVCSDCGATHPHVSFFDLHHIDPSTKEVSNSRLLSWSWEKVKEELEKCVFICPSCHRIRHIESGDYSDMNFYEEHVDSKEPSP